VVGATMTIGSAANERPLTGYAVPPAAVR